MLCRDLRSGGWKGSEWILERSHNSKYGRLRRQPHLTSPWCFHMVPRLVGRGALHHQVPWRLTSRPRTCTRFPWGLSSGRFHSAAALTGGPCCPRRRILWPSPPSSAFTAPAGGFPVDSRRRQGSIALNLIPPLPITHGLEYPLGSRMYLIVVHPRLEARGRPFPRSPRSRSCVNIRVLRPLTRGPQGRPPSLGTPPALPELRAFSELPVARFPMAGRWLSTPWQSVSQSHGAVAWRLLPPILVCAAGTALRTSVPARLILPLALPPCPFSLHLLFPSLISWLYPTWLPASPQRGST